MTTTNVGLRSGHTARAAARSGWAAAALIATTALTAGCSGGDPDASALTAVRASADSREVGLEFGVCNPDPFEVSVEETPERIVFSIEVGEGTDDDCAAGADFTLDEPVGNRPLMIQGDDGPYPIEDEFR